MSREYDRETAERLFGLALWEAEPLKQGDEKKVHPLYFVVNDGVYLTDDVLALCNHQQLGSSMDWIPALDMDWPGSPNPATAPILPIPFTADQLAACMLDGIGHVIWTYVGTRIGDRLGPSDLPKLSDQSGWVSDALREAYETAAAAQREVGEFDYGAQQQVRELVSKYDDARDAAYAREGVSDPSVEIDEYRRRRERAKKSVADLKTRSEQAVATSNAEWRVWRKAMVRRLLGPDAVQTEANWDVVPIPKRLPGYRLNLYRALEHSKAEGASRPPTAVQILELWREVPPPQLAVVGKKLRYEDADGHAKFADTEAIRKAIATLVRR